MKMENEEEKNEESFYWFVDSHFHNIKTIDICNQISRILIGSQITDSQVGPKPLK